MKRTGLFFASFLALSTTLACGDDPTGDGPDAGDDVADSGAGDPDANESDFSPAITASWTLSPGQFDVYRCARVTVDEDMYIAGFRAIDPVGTHHTVLSVRSSPNMPDGEFDCEVADIEHSMLFASGVGTDDLIFPEGVAMKVDAGSQLHLNLHLYNVSDNELSGTSGIEVKLIPAAEVEQEAEVVFAGTTAISIPPSGEEESVDGACRFSQDATVLTLWPHMHQLGRHMKVVHEKSGGGEDVLLDQPFDFNEQLNYPITPLEVKANERLRVHCTYVNDTGSTVGFGDGSEDEMCFAGVYRYPATGAGLYSCIQFF